MAIPCEVARVQRMVDALLEYSGTIHVEVAKQLRCDVKELLPMYRNINNIVNFIIVMFE